MPKYLMAFVQGAVASRCLIFDKKCEIFFRIRSRYDNAVIEITNGDETIKLPRGHMTPGEMERVSVSQKYLKNCESITIKVVEE